MSEKHFEKGRIGNTCCMVIRPAFIISEMMIGMRNTVSVKLNPSPLLNSDHPINATNQSDANIIYMIQSKEIKDLRILICGSRTWTDKQTIERYIQTLPKDTVIIEGECRGADRMAREIAEKYGLQIFGLEAEWKKYGKKAGPIRNEEMIKYGKPEIVIAFHNNIAESKGTKNMLMLAKKHNIPVKVIKSGQEIREETI